MREIVFNVTPCADTGGFIARWHDEPGHGGITTQGDSLQELQDMVRDAVEGYFEAKAKPNLMCQRAQQRKVWEQYLLD